MENFIYCAVKALQMIDKRFWRQQSFGDNKTTF